jgi:hypothetical protein
MEVCFISSFISFRDQLFAANLIFLHIFFAPFELTIRNLDSVETRIEAIRDTRARTERRRLSDHIIQFHVWFACCAACFFFFQLYSFVYLVIFLSLLAKIIIIIICILSMTLIRSTTSGSRAGPGKNAPNEDAANVERRKGRK